MSAPQSSARPPSLRDALSTRMRLRRFRLFRSLLDATPRPLRIVDIGGTQRFWETMDFLPGGDVSITLVNVLPQPVTRPGFTSVAGDARRLDFADRSFDVAFSNSVIEHVGGPEDQRRMAAEILRVAPRYFVQTPNLWFPIEPHFKFPFFQFLPIPVRTRLLMHLPLGEFGRVRDREKARAAVAEVRLLGRREFLACFPGARVWNERILGLSKSFVAYGGWD